MQFEAGKRVFVKRSHSMYVPFSSQHQPYTLTGHSFNAHNSGCEWVQVRCLAPGGTEFHNEFSNEDRSYAFYIMKNFIDEFRTEVLQAMDNIRVSQEA